MLAFRARPRRATRALLCLTAALTSQTVARSDEQEKKDSVTLQVWSIRATRANKEISPELEKLAGKLKSLFKYTGYKRVKTSSPTAEVGAPVSAELVEPYRVTITPQKKTAETIELKVEIFERNSKKESVTKLKTTFTIAPEKFQLLGGLKLEGEDALIVAISAK